MSTNKNLYVYNGDYWCRVQIEIPIPVPNVTEYVVSRSWSTDTYSNIDLDSSGNIYVVNEEPGQLKKYSPEGDLQKQLDFVRDGYNVLAMDVKVDSNDTIYVLLRDDYNSYLTWVEKYSSELVLSASWGTNISGDAMAIDKSDNIYLLDASVMSLDKYNENGIHSRRWELQGSGDGKFGNFYGIAVDNDGYIYIADYDNNRVQKLNSNGGFEAKWGLEGIGDGNFSHPVGIAIDNAGLIYVTDYYNHRIQKFKSDGEFIIKWGSEGIGEGDFYYPWGIVIDSSDNVYVVDENERIQVFTPVY